MSDLRRFFLSDELSEWKRCEFVEYDVEAGGKLVQVGWQGRSCIVDVE